LNIEVPEALAHLAATPPTGKKAFEERVDALVQINRIRKTIRLDLESRVSKARDEYRRGADILKTSEAPWADMEGQLRESLATYLAEEECDPEFSVRTYEFEGAVIMEKEIVVISDMEELVRAVAAGKAKPEYLEPNLSAIKADAKAQGHYFNAPGIAVEKISAVEMKRGKSK